MCVVSSCCCGFQTLQQGLFIHGLYDILIRLIISGMDSWSGNSTYGMEALLFFADIALAIGGKLEVRFLLVVWMVIFGVWIVLSLFLPPALILIGWIFTQYAREISGTNYFTILLSFITNIRSFDQSKVLFFTYHTLTFILGILYLYIWFCARSLYMKIAPTTQVHVLRGNYRDSKF